SKVSVVGAGMRTRPGVAARLFAALAAENIDVLMITTADIKISVLVHRDDGLRAMRTIHQSFRLHEPRTGAGIPGIGAAATPVWTTSGDETARARELTARIAAMEEVIVNDVQLATDHGRLALAGFPDRPGACAQIFATLASESVVVSAIVLNRNAAHTAELTFSVPHADLERAAARTRASAAAMDPSVRVTAESDVAVLFVWGVGMRSHAGV